MRFPKKLLFLVSLLAVGLAKIPTSFAAETIKCTGDPGNILPACVRTDCGRCDLDDFIQLFVNLSSVMLGFLSVVALALFIIAGLKLATSAGNPTKVTEAKSMMGGTLRGAALVLLGWLIINLVVTVLMGNDTGTILNGQFWYKT